MFGFLKRGSSKIPFLGTYMTQQKEFLSSAKRKFAFQRIGFDGKNLAIEMTISDFDRNRLIREEADWIIVSMKTTLKNRIKVQIQFHNLNEEDYKTMRFETRVADAITIITAITLADFKEFLQTKPYKQTPFNMDIVEILNTSIAINKIMHDIKPGGKKNEPFKTYDSILEKISSFQMYLARESTNKIIQNWCSYCLQLSNQILSLIERIREMKARGDRMLDLPPEIQTGFEKKRHPFESSKGTTRPPSINEKSLKHKEIYKAKNDQGLTPVNILLVGPDGSGKTTMINSMSNYLHFTKIEEAQNDVKTIIPSEFTMSDNRGKTAVIRCGGNLKLASPVNQAEYLFDGQIFNVVDTPGFTLEHSVDEYLQTIKNLTATTSFQIICVVVRSNGDQDETLLVKFLQVMPELLKICLNIFFIFTHTSVNFYKSGSSKEVISQTLADLHIQVDFNQNNTYCLDNEPYRYLCAFKHIKFQNFEKELYAKSWTVSSVETVRLLKNVVILLGRDRRKSNKVVRTSMVPIKPTEAVSVTPETPKTPQLQEVTNLLVVGPPGSGKTTLINSIVNYTTYRELDDAEDKVISDLPVAFTIADHHAKEVVIRRGKTNAAGTCSFSYQEKSYTFIDTLGFRSTDTFVKDVERASHSRKINMILIVLRADETNDLTRKFLQALPLLRHVCDSFAVCYTFSALRNYQPGDSFPYLQPILLDLRSDRIFCFDNECYRYLCAMEEIKVDKQNKKQLTTSWNRSSTATKNMLGLFLSPPKPAIRTQTKKESTVVSKSDINVLVLGPSGSGKTTLINSLSNYLSHSQLENAEKNVKTEIANKFTISLGNKSITVSCGDGPPSKTFHVFDFKFDNSTFSFIDTPTFVDTRTGDDYFKTIKNFTKNNKIHFICAVFKSNDSRANPILTSFIQVIPRLYQICQNVVFCFTHSAMSFYKYGDTLSIIATYLKNMGVPLSMNKDQMYGLDNEAYRYLCSLDQLRYNKAEADAFKKSWDESSAEMMRMLKYFKRLKKPVMPPPPPPPVTEIQPSKEGINILVVGPAGVGRTTFINSLANHLKYKSLSDAESGVVTVMYCEFQLSTKEGRSFLIKCRCPQSESSWEFEYGGMPFKIFDSPGYDGDPQYIENLKTAVNNTPIDTICILLKSNESRENAVIKSFLNQIPLLASLAKRVCICFTHSSSSLYKPGDTFSLLSNMSLSFPLDLESVYIFDNEAYRYLNCLGNISFESSERNAFNISWNKSGSEFERFLKIQLRQHRKKDNDVNLTEIQQFICQLSETVLLKIIQVAKDIDQKNKLDYQLLDSHQIKSRIKKKIQATIQIDPIYFCINESCPNATLKDKDDSTWTLKVLKSQHCRVAMSKGGSCSSCHCPISDHLRVSEIHHQEEVDVSASSPVDPKLQEQITKLEKSIKKIYDDINAIITDVANLNLYLKGSEPANFVDEFESSIHTKLEDHSQTNITLKEELIKVKQAYQSFLSTMSSNDVTTGYLDDVKTRKYLTVV